MSDLEFQHAAARADLCRLLAACYYEPGPEFVEDDVFGSLRRAAAGSYPALVPVVDEMAEDFGKRPLQDLKIDYTALFLSPGGALASPYESVRLAGKDPMPPEQRVQAVIEFYAGAGFQVADDFRDLPDHIAAELEFLYALVFREARARASADEAEVAAATDLQRRFVERHLGRWVGEFSEAMRTSAATGFYRSLAELTRRFVEAAQA